MGLHRKGVPGVVLAQGSHSSRAERHHSPHRCRRTGVGDWQRMCDDELADEDLVLVAEDAALSSITRRKRPDAWAARWGRRIPHVLEFTRPNDWAGDWQARTDAYNEGRYAPLREQIRGPCPGGRRRSSPSPCSYTEDKGAI